MSVTFHESELSTLVRERIDQWRENGRPDAARLLDEFPALARVKSLVLELILEEYCLRTEAGDKIITSEFCEQFPVFRRSVFKMLEVQELLDRCPDFAAPVRADEWPQPGQSFLGFQLTELLGFGALARVYLARQPQLGNRLVALKVSQFGGGEAAKLGKLSHPGIVPVYSVDHDDETGWTAICMPLLGAATAIDLLDAFKGGPPPVDGKIISRVARESGPSGAAPNDGPALEWQGRYDQAIARFGSYLAEALAHAHSLGISHRDIKPSNVLLSWSGRPMLLDFNLATEADVAGPRLGGTPAYMAPELLAKLMENSEIAPPCDPRCDIYSLGVVLFELLTGRLPAQPDNAEQLPADAFQAWLKSKQAPPPSISSLNSAVAQQLEAIVLKCLAYDPATRYVTANQLADDLRAFLPPPPAPRSRRREMLIALAATILVLVLAGSSWLGRAAYLRSLPPEHQRLLKQGLAQYDRGEFREAAATLESSLAANPGWGPALFARGQSLRRLDDWSGAEACFSALEHEHKGWAHALAGYCRLRAGSGVNSYPELASAYGAGLRETGFLLNYAYALVKIKFYPQAINVYTEVLDREPNNAYALRNRERAQMGRAMDMRQIPDVRAFEDARRDCALNPQSFEAPFVAAMLSGYAASRPKSDPQFVVWGKEFLARALKNGLPKELVQQEQSLFKPFLDNDADIQRLVENAPAEESDYRFRTTRVSEPPLTASWEEFLADPRALPLPPSR